MITGELRSQVDKILEAFWTGKISTPLTIIEQFICLFFICQLDKGQLLKEKKANIANIPFFKPIYPEAKAELLWSSV